MRRVTAPGAGDSDWLGSLPTVLLRPPSRIEVDEVQRAYGRATSGASGDAMLSLEQVEDLLEQLSKGEVNVRPALMRGFRTANAVDGWLPERELEMLVEFVNHFNLLWDRYDEIDTSGDRRVTLDEFKRGCHIAGLPLAGAEASAAFASIDMEGRGRVLFDDFCTWFASVCTWGVDNAPPRRVVAISTREPEVMFVERHTEGGAVLREAEVLLSPRSGRGRVLSPAVSHTVESPLPATQRWVVGSGGRHAWSPRTDDVLDAATPGASARSILRVRSEMTSRRSVSPGRARSVSPRASTSARREVVGSPIRVRSRSRSPRRARVVGEDDEMVVTQQIGLTPRTRASPPAKLAGPALHGGAARRERPSSATAAELGSARGRRARARRPSSNPSSVRARSALGSRRKSPRTSRSPPPPDAAGGGGSARRQRQGRSAARRSSPRLMTSPRGSVRGAATTTRPTGRTRSRHAARSKAPSSRQTPELSPRLSRSGSRRVHSVSPRGVSPRLSRRPVSSARRSVSPRQRISPRASTRSRRSSLARSVSPRLASPRQVPAGLATPARTARARTSLSPARSSPQLVQNTLVVVTQAAPAAGIVLHESPNVRSGRVGVLHTGDTAMFVDKATQAAAAWLRLSPAVSWDGGELMMATGWVKLPPPPQQILRSVDSAVAPQHRSGNRDDEMRAQIRHESRRGDGHAPAPAPPAQSDAPAHAQFVDGFTRGYVQATQQVMQDITEVEMAAGQGTERRARTKAEGQRRRGGVDRMISLPQPPPSTRTTPTARRTPAASSVRQEAEAETVDALVSGRPTGRGVAEKAAAASALEQETARQAAQAEADEAEAAAELAHAEAELVLAQAEMESVMDDADAAVHRVSDGASASAYHAYLTGAAGGAPHADEVDLVDRQTPARVERTPSRVASDRDSRRQSGSGSKRAKRKEKKKADGRTTAAKCAPPPHGLPGG